MREQAGASGESELVGQGRGAVLPAPPRQPSALPTPTWADVQHGVPHIDAQPVSAVVVAAGSGARGAAGTRGAGGGGGGQRGARGGGGSRGRCGRCGCRCHRFLFVGPVCRLACSVTWWYGLGAGRMRVVGAGRWGDAPLGAGEHPRRGGGHPHLWPPLQVDPALAQHPPKHHPASPHAPYSACACMDEVRIWTSMGTPPGPTTAVCRLWYPEGYEGGAGWRGQRQVCNGGGVEQGRCGAAVVSRGGVRAFIDQTSEPRIKPTHLGLRDVVVLLASHAPKQAVRRRQQLVARGDGLLLAPAGRRGGRGDAGQHV